MPISVVIPTCDRKYRVLSLLEDLGRSTHPIHEVIVVDSGDDRLTPTDLARFTHFPICCLYADRSVCVQRNIGIKAAKGDFIFLCDDDIEVPADYLQTLRQHFDRHPEANAVSGHILQKENGCWQKNYPIRSWRRLLWTWTFGQSIWGEIECKDHPLTRRLKHYYHRKGNHLSKTGWPILTDFSGDFFATPVFGLGASLIRKRSLLQSLYDEVLDRHGIGDNYGVAAGLPPHSIHIVTAAFVYHHQSPQNRLHTPLAWFRRALALDYFRQTNPALQQVKKRWLLWSLSGSCLLFLAARDFPMLRAASQSLWLIGSNQNPYALARRQNKKITEPLLNQRQ